MAGTPAYAGAWPQKKGEALLITTSLVDRADRHWDNNRNIDSDGFFYKDELSAYAEYGLSDAFTLVGRVAWQTVRRRDGLDFDSAQGLSASELGLRRVIGRSGTGILSIQGVVLIPGEGENVSTQRLGDGGPAADIRLLAGRALGDDQFIDVQTAFRWRDEPHLNEARLDVTWGRRLSPDWQVLVQTYSVWSMEDGRPGIPGFDQHKIQLSVGRRVGELEYHIGLSATPAGRNAIEERALLLSVWRRF